MSAEAQALLFGVAFILFVIAAFVTSWKADGRNLPMALVAAGLAAITLVRFWDAWKLATA